VGRIATNISLLTELEPRTCFVAWSVAHEREYTLIRTGWEFLKG